MACPTANMDECNPKCRCLIGDCIGLAYDCGDPCPPGEEFNKETCECEPTKPYFIEYAWYRIFSEFNRSKPNNCVTGWTYYNGGKLIGGVNSGMTGIDPQGISWLLVPFATCTDAGCSTDGASNVNGYFVDANGVAGANPRLLDRAICYDDKFRQIYFETGLVTGYGDTLELARCDAKAKEPLLNIYPDCS